MSTIDTTTTTIAMPRDDRVTLLPRATHIGATSVHNARWSGCR